MRGAPPRTQMKVYMDPRHKVSKPGGYKNWRRTTKLTLLPFLLTVTVQTEASNRSGVFPNENLSFSHREAVKQNDRGWVETQSILKKYKTWLGIWMFLCMPWVNRMQYGKNKTWNKHIKPLTTVPLMLCDTFAISFDFGTFLLRKLNEKTCDVFRTWYRVWHGVEGNRRPKSSPFRGKLSSQRWRTMWRNTCGKAHYANLGKWTFQARGEGAKWAPTRSK